MTYLIIETNPEGLVVQNRREQWELADFFLARNRHTPGFTLLGIVPVIPEKKEGK